MKINKDWRHILEPTVTSEKFQDLISKIKEKSRSTVIYPEYSNLFRAFNECPYKKLNCIIIAQDPYHNFYKNSLGERKPYAQGTAFSNPSDVPEISPSLKNILKEVHSNVYNEPLENFDNVNPDLTRWANQGVLLLNAGLTVEKSKPGSDLKDWIPITKEIVSRISIYNSGLIWMLWGKFAQSYKDVIGRNHYILEAPHPSPFSAYTGFFGCKHFSKANEILKKNNNEEILW